MAFSSWRVAVLITGANLAGPAFTSLSSQAAGANARIMATRNSILALRATALAAFAAIGVAIGKEAYEAAGQFQLAMTNVGVATGATRSQLRDLGREVLNLSNITAQSAPKTASMFAIMARSGLNNPAQLARLGPEIAKFADVQQFLTGSDPTTTSKQAVQLVHLFQDYTPQTMGPLLNQVSRLMMMQPEDLSRIVRQASYFVPIAHGMGMSDTEAIQIMAAMGRTGLLLGKGGTGSANAILGGINAVTVTGHLQARQADALRALGVIDASGRNIMFDSAGHVTMMPLLNQLSSIRGKWDAVAPGLFMNELMAGFGKQGGRFLATLATPVVMHQLHLMQGQLSGPNALPGIDQAWAKYTSTLPFKLQQLKTNFVNLLTVLASPSMGTVISAIGKLVDVLSRLTGYFQAHPEAANAVMAGGAGLTVAAGVGAVATAGQLMRNIWAHGGAGVAGRAALRNPALSGVLGGAGGLAGLFMNPLKGGWLGNAARALFGGVEQRAGIQLIQPGLLRTGGLISGAGDMAAAIGMRAAAIFAPVGRVFSFIAPLAAKFATGLLEVGVRVLGIITWVGMAAQALQFFAQHPKDIGKWVGEIIGWIYYKFWPLLKAGLTWVFTQIINMFVSMAKAIWNVVSWLAWAVFHPIQAAGQIKSWGSNFWSAATQGIASQAPGGGAVINAPITINHSGPIDQNTARRHAEAIIEHLNKNFRPAIRSTPILPRGMHAVPATHGTLGILLR